MADVGVIIPAGGAGRRFGGSTPKQFVRLEGVPILVRTVELFTKRRDVAAIVVAAPSGDVSRVRRMLAAAGHGGVTVVAGGKERQHSVWNGLEALPSSCEFVLVHDAVRPFTPPRVISSVVNEARAHGASVVGVPAGDTLRREGRRPGFLSATVDRTHLWAVQTPQGFRTELLREAHRDAARKGILKTDETSLVELMGIEVKVVEGTQSNIKITTKNDLEFARFLAKRI
jgi:2-C-methyl-D-erythritol 4-phosphate cytidylyltransferase